jgi:DUF971 family protein
MSFWDTLRPAAKAPVATALTVSADQAQVTVEWNDGLNSNISARRLRQYCPCAECVEEWSGRRTYDVESISDTVKVLQFSGVGNYAVTFTFSDMHKMGIYNWATLRELVNASGVKAG